MTNPISKAIVKAAVAMGYGKKSDYKGSSVADVLEKFAAIAKDKGSSGGGETFVIESSGTIMTEIVPITSYEEAKAAFLARKRVVFVNEVFSDALSYSFCCPAIALTKIHDNQEWLMFNVDGFDLHGTASGSAKIMMFMSDGTIKYDNS